MTFSAPPIHYLQAVDSLLDEFAICKSKNSKVLTELYSRSFHKLMKIDFVIYT